MKFILLLLFITMPLYPQNVDIEILEAKYSDGILLVSFNIKNNEPEIIFYDELSMASISYTIDSGHVMTMDLVPYYISRFGPVSYPKFNKAYPGVTQLSFSFEMDGYQVLDLDTGGLRILSEKRIFEYLIIELPIFNEAETAVAGIDDLKKIMAGEQGKKIESNCIKIDIPPGGGGHIGPPRRL
jgi:hypothetical protein